MCRYGARMARTPDLERRLELLDRIVQYLAVYGLAQATLRPMAKELDVSINRLVHHFGTKEELLTAALRRALDQQIEVQNGFFRRSSNLTQAEVFRQWWRWMNSSPANLAVVRLNYEAAALDPTVTGLSEDVRAEQIGFWRHDVEQRLRGEGLTRAQAVMEASLTKAMFTGLAMDLFATGDRRRLNAAFTEFLRRLNDRMDAYRA